MVLKYCKGRILSIVQIANNIAMSLHRKQVKIIGTNPENIDNAENRFKFSRMYNYQINIDQPEYGENLPILILYFAIL